jgi:hypothetical protein
MTVAVPPLATRSEALPVERPIEFASGGVQHDANLAAAGRQRRWPLYVGLAAAAAVAALLVALWPSDPADMVHIPASRPAPPPAAERPPSPERTAEPEAAPLPGPPAALPIPTAEPKTAASVKAPAEPSGKVPATKGGEIKPKRKPLPRLSY